MSNPLPGFTIERSPSAKREHVTRVALIAVVIAGMLLTSPRSIALTSSPPAPRSWELRATGGELVASGKQRKSIGNAQLTALQLSWVLRPTLALNATLGWARSRDLSSAGHSRLDIFTTDVGAEFRPAAWFAGSTVTFSPFAGLGAGARTYNPRHGDSAATTNLAGYGSVGGEFGIGRVALRLEVRDYLSGFKPLVSAGSVDTRNDLTFMLAVRFIKRDTSQD